MTVDGRRARSSMQDSFYILATSSRADDRTPACSSTARRSPSSITTATSAGGLGEQGLYHDGTRFLSRLELRLGGRPPLLLELDGQQDNDAARGRSAPTPTCRRATARWSCRAARCTSSAPKFLLARRLLRAAALRQLRPRAECDVAVGCRFDADFADIFEVRGVAARPRAADAADPAVEVGDVVLAYAGLDGVRRRAADRSIRPPRRCSSAAARALRR